MKKHLVPVVFIILAITVTILPLLPKSEAEEEFTYVDGMNYRNSFADEDILYIYGSDGIIAELPAEGLEGYTLDFRSSAILPW